MFEILFWATSVFVRFGYEIAHLLLWSFAMSRKNLPTKIQFQSILLTHQAIPGKAGPNQFRPG